jgi:DNA-binding transcriptional regulator GbsR (MarR family)
MTEISDAHEPSPDGTGLRPAFRRDGLPLGHQPHVGQIYALLYVSDRPLNAEDIVEKLGVSRSNVSMGLKELDTWRLIRRMHLPDDRREHFSALEDPWAVIRTLAEERRSGRSTRR